MVPVNRSQRVFAATAVASFAVWVLLIVLFGGLRFDDFVNIAESEGALSPSGWMGLAADGRWQPLKRATYALVARFAGLTFWPYAAALLITHAVMAWGVAVCAREIWSDRAASTTAGLVALASLNLSAFSVSYAATLHGIGSVTLSVWCVALSLRGGLDRRHVPTLAAGALLGVAACLYKESAVMTPAFAMLAAWLAVREGQRSVRTGAWLVAPAVVGVLAYLLLRTVVDVPWIPTQGRYGRSGTWRPLLNAAVTLIQVMPWVTAASLGAVSARGRAGRAAGALWVATALATIGVILPTLVLSWQSPNFFYAVTPVAALAAAAASRIGASSRLAFGALTAMLALALVGSVGVAARRGAHRWGPYAQSSLEAWLALPRETGGRVIWFDADSRASYGGLARTIGPGDRLAFALRLATGDASIEAAACISVLVGPPCLAGPGDVLYLHRAGRVERIDEPPPGSWHIMP